MSISAKTGEGLDRLLAAIGERLDAGAKRVTIHLPYDKGGLVERLYQEAKVEQVDYGETIDVVAVCTPKTIGQLGPLVEGWQPHKVGRLGNAECRNAECRMRRGMKQT